MCHLKLPSQFRGTQLTMKAESLGETLDLIPGSVCPGEPLASSSHMSLMFGGSRKKRSWSEPFDASNGGLLSKGQGCSQYTRSQIDSHIQTLIKCL